VRPCRNLGPNLRTTRRWQTSCPVACPRSDL
jgi:hypothetical protein